MGTRANYLLVKNKPDCEKDQWLKVGDEFLESNFEKVIFEKYDLEMVANTTTHWDGHPDCKIPVLAELFEDCKETKDTDWQEKLNDFFGEDGESGCDFVYIYNVRTNDFAILFMDFPLFDDGRCRFAYNCIWSGKFSEISTLYNDNEELANDLLGETIEKYRKSRNGKVYHHYDETNLMFVEEDVE